MGLNEFMKKKFSSKRIETIERQTSEKWFERDLGKEVEKMNGICIKQANNNQRGIPDRLVVLPGGRTLWVEVKSKGKYSEPAQRSYQTRLRNRGHEVWVVGTNANSYIKLLENLWEYTYEGLMLNKIISENNR